MLVLTLPAAGQIEQGTSLENKISESNKWYNKLSEMYMLRQSDFALFQFAYEGVSLGYASAQNILGDYYYEGRGTKPDTALALKYYLLAINNEDSSWFVSSATSAAILLSLTKDYDFCFKVASINPTLDSKGMLQMILAALYENGNGCTQNYDSALYWYTESIKCGNYSASEYCSKLRIKLFNDARFKHDSIQNIPGQMEFFEGNRLVSQGKREEAKQYYENGAKLGNWNCKLELAYMYYNNRINPDTRYMYAVEAAEDSPYNSLMLAICLEHGYGCQKNYQESLKYYRIGAEVGDYYCQYKLGIYYLNNFNNDTTNIIKAIDWLIKAAQRGLTEAFIKLGDLYYDGQFVEKDYKSAYNWYSLSAPKNDNYSLLKCTEICLLGGNGSTKDITTAMKWFDKGVKQNNVENVEYYLLLNEYINKTDGDSIPFSIYTKAAENDNDFAMYKLGEIYRNSAEYAKELVREYSYKKCKEKKEHYQSVYKSRIKEAAQWYKKAADAGNIMAEFSFAQCAENGIGTKKIEKNSRRVLQQSVDSQSPRCVYTSW